MLHKKIFCSAPFTNLRVENWHDNSLMFKPCCVYKTQQPITSLADFIHGPEMQALRNNKLVETDPIPQCSNCTIPEKLGQTSIRQQLLQQPWASDIQKIVSLEIFFSNTCNLGCFMCDSVNSSFAANERYQAKIYSKKGAVIDNVDAAVEAIAQLPDLVNVTFLGGEFFLHKRNAKILDVIHQRQLKCSIVTNASVISQSLLQQLQKISNLDISISVDGTDSIYEFMRYPANWNQLNSNIEYLRSVLTHATYSVSTVFQPLNVQNLHKLYQWANSKKLKIHHQQLVSPEFLTWKILSPNEKQQVTTLLRANQTVYKLTSKQKLLIDEVANGIIKDNFDQHQRFKAVVYLGKLLTHRNIPADVVRDHFGILDNLANEVLEYMHTQ